MHISCVFLNKYYYRPIFSKSKRVSRNELSFNPNADKDKSLEETHASVIGRRMTVTAEVGISKIFPAGFGWQTSAYFAEGAYELFL